jgi:phosphatidylglycerol---prolipoprotein diacylglyceryl transferase
LALQFPDFDPVAIPIPAIHLGSLVLGPFPIRWYALAYIAGILIGWRYCVALVRNQRLWGGRTPTLNPVQIDDLVFWITLAVIVGGRIGYIVAYMLVNDTQRAELFQHPFEVFEIWKGGMAFHGAAIGVGVAMAAFAWFNKMGWTGVLGIADLVAACEPIGQFFGRVANFINGELWGRPTNVPWGMNFCNTHTEPITDPPPAHCPADVPGPDGLWMHVGRHPSQLYEAALEGVVLFLVLRWATHRALWLQRPGAVVGLWLAGYGLIRIVLETVRNPDLGMPPFPLGLTMGMMLSIPMVAVGGVLLWRALRQAPPTPAAPAAESA